jgi:adenylate cyclase
MKKLSIKKILLNPWGALVTLAILLAMRAWDPSFIESVRLRYFDQLIINQPTSRVPVNTVNIDEASLDKYGQFPFPRDIYAQIIQDLYKRDAGLVVFNVLMPEKDRFNKDSILEKTLEKYPVVLPALGSMKSKNIDAGSPVQVIGTGIEESLVNYPGLISSVNEISDRAAGVGIVNTFPEIDGVVRRIPMIIQTGENIHPSLALETLRVGVGDSRIQVKVTGAGIDAIRIPKLNKIPIDPISRVWIDWSSTPTEFSLMNLPTTFNKEIVVVGLSAAGLVQPIATAKGEVWPQYLQASLLGTLLNGRAISRPGDADQIEIYILALAGIVLICLMRWVYVGIFASLIIISGVIIGSIYAYSHYLILLDSTFVAVGLLLVALHAYIVKFVSEFLQKQQIRKQFSTYLSPDLVAKLVKDPSLLRLGGEEKELTILFSDVRGFTGISEHYGKDVQGLTKIMNRYMTAMTKKILENNGTLDKYIGDAQMAFWNSPLDNTVHCKEAVKSALEMIGSLDEFNKEISAEGTPPFGMGIGINTGVVVVGNMGSEQRFDYTCLGDAVNLASRLEGQSKNYGVLIVLGPVTAERVGDEFFTIELDCIAVKGKTEGVTIYTVLNMPSSGNSVTEWLLAREGHEEMLASYRRQDWDLAVQQVNDLIGEFDGQLDNYYSLWLERIEEMRQAGLPDNWDGVFRAQSK